MNRSTVTLLALLFFLFAAGGVSTAPEDDAVATAGEEIDDSLLRDINTEPYRTPRAGEGFRARVFDFDVREPPRNRRSVNAWDIGVATTAPGADGNEVVPFGSLYFWRHPDEDTLFRGIVLGVFNRIFYSKSPEGFGPFELVLTFENLTVPIDSGEIIDGTRLDEEEIETGEVRPGFGFGYRRQVDPGEQDNMFALTFTVEPSYLYFDEGSDTAPTFAAPQDTFELRLRAQVRWDAMIRNLLELPHQGFQAGADLIYGHRASWEDWGAGRSRSGDEGQDHLLFAGYVGGATQMPFLESERHRLLGFVHGGVGSDLDRFSAQRLGGGPAPFGEEYGSTWRPVLPGAAINEFFPEHYVVAVGEYRWEPIFFTYLSARASVGYLDRDRRLNGTIERQDDVFAALGARITTGFVFRTRLQIDYNANFGVIRQSDFGGHEVTFHISASF